MVRSHNIHFDTVFSTISGVVSNKWHTNKKVSNQARMKISRANEEEDYLAREKIFESHREELCVEFRFVHFLVI